MTWFESLQKLRGPKRHLRDRLRLKVKRWVDLGAWSDSLEIARTRAPNATPFELAWSKDSVAHTSSLMALVGYFAEQPDLARQYAKLSLEASIEFLFGDWRNTYLTEAGHPDPSYWKRHFSWMGTFESALFWGSVLGDWPTVQKVATFPEPDSNITTGYRPQDRDLLVALGAFLCHAPDLPAKLERATTGPRKTARLTVEMIQACLARDHASLQKTLLKFLAHYQKMEFPREDITLKVSFKGTFFFHWARKEGLPVCIPPEYSDHIVPSDLIAPTEPMELRSC